MTHVHYDLTAAEADIRASIEAAKAEGQKMVDVGQADRTFIQAQREFDEARIQFVLAGMRSENAGISREEMLSAAGQTIGQMWANALQAALGARERAVLNGWVQIALQGAIGAQAAGKTINTVIEPLQSGNA